MRATFRWIHATAAGCLLLLPAGGLRADDLTTLSGEKYRQVRAVRVEPDGIVWEHATGMCKIDFTDLPESVRKTYHYDAAQAAAYKAGQEQTRQAAIERSRAILQDADARHAKALQARTQASGAVANDGSSFTFRRDLSAATAQREVGDAMAVRKQEKDLLTKDDGTIWDRRLWAIPQFLLGGPGPDVSAHPLINPNDSEYRASVHNSPGTLPSFDTARNPFFEADYMTNSYDDDVRRAEAFDRGRP